MDEEIEQPKLKYLYINGDAYESNTIQDDEKEHEIRRKGNPQ